MTFDMNIGPFDERIVLDHLNAKLVRYSDPHCILLWHCPRYLSAYTRMLGLLNPRQIFVCVEWDLSFVKGGTKQCKLTGNDIPKMKGQGTQL